MELFDSHCHLNDEKFDQDREETLQRMHEWGVTRCVCVGSDLATSRSSLDFANAHENVYAACGVHPHEAKDAPADYIGRLEEMLKEKKAVALGEIGLDYYYDLSPRETQKKALEEQLELAVSLDAPVIFHVRDAHGDMLDILRGRRRLPRGIVHCFSGSAETAKEYLKMGFYISFAGPLTFKKAPNLWAAAAAVPPERLLVETDSPYLAPEPVRGRRNEPANVRFVCEKLAALRGMTAEETAALTTKNARAIYDVP